MMFIKSKGELRISYTDFDVPMAPTQGKQHFVNVCFRPYIHIKICLFRTALEQYFSLMVFRVTVDVLKKGTLVIKKKQWCRNMHCSSSMGLFSSELIVVHHHAPQTLNIIRSRTTESHQYLDHRWVQIRAGLYDLISISYYEAWTLTCLSRYIILFIYDNMTVF